MRILLIEDHPIFRFGVRSIILNHWPKATVGEVETIKAALNETRKGSWDIAILDLNLPDSHGIESLPLLRKSAPFMGILVLSLHDENAYAKQVLMQGAQGYLTKDNAADELVIALQRISDGERYISRSLADQMAKYMFDKSGQPNHQILGPQEYRVMLQMAEGMRISDIAENMHLSPKTVSTYRNRIFEKLGFTTNLDLIRYCSNHLVGNDRL
jgi:two-component system invasion response regulator UvrY